MTPQEALANIKRGKCIPYKKATITKIAELCEKQIPKQHHHTKIVEINCRARESICPACLCVIITSESEYPKYCTWCGQAIDWSDA